MEAKSKVVYWRFGIWASAFATGCVCAIANAALSLLAVMAFALLAFEVGRRVR